MANTNLKLVGLDFETLKANFKEYLKRQDSPFKDVDYEGSNINQLLDVLSYNTYLNAFYLNMVASEMFLDSATLRDSIVSHAKELNYVPRSHRSAQAKISFSIIPTGAVESILIPKGFSFSTKVGSNNYTFSTSESNFYIANSSGQFTITDLAIYEGTYINDAFVYDNANTSQRFVLSNPAIDTSSLTVIISENNGANNYLYIKASSFLDQAANSQVYFLQPAENSQYEIVFGDDVIGRKPVNGAAILAEYRVSNGSFPNGASVFVPDGSINGQAITNVTTSQLARGGIENESLSSIKFNAPRSYQNQDRAVTSTDYENILLANFSDIQAVAAYGGEDADPPQYGRVFISVDVASGDGSSIQDKNRYLEFIKTKCSVGIEPIFIDPKFLYLDVVANVRYNINITNMLPSSIETLVRNTIKNYNTESLNGFKKTFRFSKLIEDINNSSSSIVGVDLYAHPNIRINPLLNTSYSSTLNFGFRLAKEQSFATSSENYIKSSVRSVYSSKFTYESTSCTLQDDGNGKLGIYRFDSAGNSVFIKNIGIVDYVNGYVTITGLVVSDYEGTAIHVHVNPYSRDITAYKNTILKISDLDTEVFVEPVRE